MQVSEEVEAIEGDGNRAAAVPGRPADAGTLCADAVPERDLERRGDLCQCADLPRLFQRSRSSTSRIWCCNRCSFATSLLVFLKSFMFGCLIGAIACYRGLDGARRAAGVGTATTSSVVTAITTVIGFDTPF